ncbi:MAG TPA: TetR/AcrR family transcriptional regulator [Propionibacteriaceae bacterium]|nr:TetR/AcrR family transcriptional regulator [Propionibacteriaceae bacterium]
MTRSTRPAIVRAAVDRLRRGDAGFTYERLAADAGVARQTLYSRFPDRAELIIAAVDELRAEVPELDELTTAVQLAPSGRAALEALLDLHVAFTPRMLNALSAVEAQRAVSPGLSSAFERRASGRRQLVRSVVTRLQAEGDLASGWSVDEASDLLGALLTGAFAAELMNERRWSAAQLRHGLHRTLTRALLRPDQQAEPTTTNPGGPA